jgi:D-alanyl-D-alanine carboxypeptidase
MLNKIIYTILGIGIALIFFPRPVKDQPKPPEVLGNATEIIATPKLKATPEMAALLPAPILTAKAAVAYDLNSGSILYAKNLDETLPIASLTKLVTALTVMKSQDLSSVVTITKRDQGMVGSSIGLVAGEKITVNDLVHAMLIPSSNDATVALANYISGSETAFAGLGHWQ